VITPATRSTDVKDAVDLIRSRVPEMPTLGLILGSGLSDLAEMVDDPVILETASLPGYPASTVEGHKGRLVFGRLGSIQVVFVQGRLHVYEGHSVKSATFPVRVLGGLGVNRLIVTNAAGGIRPEFSPGTLMWITDHINMAFRHPHSRKASADGRSTSAAHHPWDEAWTTAAKAVADRLGIVTQEGCYLWTLGPSYETRAEIRMFAGFGADAVGMSTVPEVLEANELGMRVLGLSTITNHAAGLGHESLNHEEVLEVGRQVRGNLERLILALVDDLA